jgi:hypothetical protein
MVDLTPQDWEALYRSNPEAIRERLEQHPPSEEVASFWWARLAADGRTEAQPKKKLGFTFPILAATLIALPFLIPYWKTGRFDPEWAQPWMGFLAFFPLTLWHALKAGKEVALRSRFALGSCLGATLMVVGLNQYLNTLPRSWNVRAGMDGIDPETADRILVALQTQDLMLFHAPLFLLGLTGAVWSWSRSGGSRVEFIRNGLQVVIYSGLILAGGGLFAGLTVVMAEMLGLDTEPIAVHIMCWGASGILVFAHHVWMRHPNALQRILPVIAGLFVPLFVLLEGGFLLTYLSKGLRELTEDREELLVFNLLLGAVIGLVLLHSALKQKQGRIGQALVGALIVLGVFADLIGIAAIGSRLLQWGLTPNRLAVLATNLLFLSTLLALIPSLFGRFNHRGWPDITGILNRALPVFVVWTAVVALLFPASQWWQLRDIDMKAFRTELDAGMLEEGADSAPCEPE